MQVGQEKAGASPHTLQERRPRDNIETQKTSQTDEIQQIKQQRESLSRENQNTEIGEVAGGQRMSQSTPKEDGNKDPDHFFAAPYESENVPEERAQQLTREAMTNDVLEEVCTSLDDAITEAGMNLDEEGLEREVMAFLQRVRWEDTHPPLSTRKTGIASVWKRKHT